MKVDVQVQRFRQAPCPSTGTETAPVAVECHPVLDTTGVAADAQEKVLHAAALDGVLELPTHDVRQGSALPGQVA